MLRFLISMIVATAVLAGCSSKRPAATTAVSDIAYDVWTAYDAFNNIYLDSAKFIYKNTDRDAHAGDRDHGAAAIWCQPMYVDMAMNAVELARKNNDKARQARYSAFLQRLLEGNISQYLDFDYDNNDLMRGWFIYDDIQWWTITLARAYFATGNERYRALAEQAFARVWYGSPRVGDTGSYADPARGLGGGMFWQWQPIDNPNPNRPWEGKMSCINFPTVVAAMLLYRAAPSDRQADPAPTQWVNQYGEFSRPHYETRQRYLEMAAEIYDWAVHNLADPATGRVIDNRHGDRVGGAPLIYNQGTYIGASALLYLATGDEQYLQNAINAADYSINVMSAEHGVLPWAHNPRRPGDQGSLEQGIYPAIWGEYMKILVRDCGQRQYIPFIEHNVTEGWANRDPERLICDGRAWAPTPTNPDHTSDRTPDHSPDHSPNHTPDHTPAGRHYRLGSYSASTTPALWLILELIR